MITIYLFMSMLLALDCSAMDDPAVLQLAATIKFYLGHFRQSLDFAQRSLSIVEKVVNC